MNSKIKINPMVPKCNNLNMSDNHGTFNYCLPLRSSFLLNHPTSNMATIQVMQHNTTTTTENDFYPKLIMLNNHEQSSSGNHSKNFTESSSPLSYQSLSTTKDSNDKKIKFVVEQDRPCENVHLMVEDRVNQSTFEDEMNRLNRIKSYFTSFPKKTGTWPQFLDWKQFSFPETWDDITRRVPDNIQVFFSNYSCMSIVLIVYCLMTSPLLLIAMSVYSIILYAIYRCNDEVAICGMDPWSRNEQMIIATVFFIPGFILLGLTSTFFWLVGVITFFVAIHAIFHESLKTSAVDQAANTTPMTAVIVESSSKQTKTETAPIKTVIKPDPSAKTMKELEDKENEDDDDDDDQEEDDEKNEKTDKIPVKIKRKKSSSESKEKKPDVIAV